MENILAGCSGFGEFKVRNCLEQPPPNSGHLYIGALMIHHFPIDERKLPVNLLMQIKRCHSTDRLEITE